MILDEVPMTDSNGLIFYSYGYQNFFNHVFAFPYYFPKTLLDEYPEIVHPFYKKIERERNKATGYLRFHSIAECLQIARGLGYKIVIDTRYGLPIVELSKNKITKIFNPFCPSKLMFPLRKQISNFFKISISNIGITRSHLTGLNTNKSNIDISIKGVENFKKIVKNLNEFLKQSNFKKVSMERISRHVNLLPKEFDKLKPKIKNKFWPSFVYCKKNIDINFIKAENEVLLQEILEERGREKVKAIIFDPEESFFAPYKFLIKIKSPKRYSSQKAYLIMYSRFLSGIFKNNEEITFLGKLRKIKENKGECLEFTFEQFID